MRLIDVAENAQYITDEVIESVNILGIINQCIGHVNTEAKTNLPLSIADHIAMEPGYIALTDSWQLRLFEPYYSWTIASNDDSDRVDFHYSRFLDALNAFLNSDGTGIIDEFDEDGNNLTNYGADFGRIKAIDASDIHINWRW